MDHIFNILGTG